MAGYFGSETQRLLQQRAEASAEFARVTPGACQAARMLATDDPDLLSWAVIDAGLARDGVFGFRLLPTSSLHGLRIRLQDRGCRLDCWDVFAAASRQLAAPARAAARLPAGYRRLPAPKAPEGAETRSLQELMSRCGVAPFSGSFLVGAMGPAVTVAIGSDGPDPVAVAHVYLPHNAHSPFQRHAWLGLVAVDAAHRGRGLGTSATGLAIGAAGSELDASHVYALVAPDNLASRRMLEAAGLAPCPGLTCGVAVARPSPRFSR